MKNIYTLLLIIFLTACTSIKVREVDSSHQISHVCIQDNPRVVVGDFISVVRKGFKRHGITTEVYHGRKPGYCEYHLNYTALKTWDIGTYMHHAELTLYRGRKDIAYAEYHLVGKGGLALNKWASVESKMNPVIDKLLSNFSPEKVDAYRKAIPTADENSADKTTKLRELKRWFDEGLISKKEYSQKKREILDK